MRPLRDAWSQLVERRLWPLALALALGVVAVPLVLAKQPAPGEASSAPARPVAPAAAAAGVGGPVPAVVRAVEEDAAGAPLRGRPKDPFRQQHVPRPASPSTGTGDGPSGMGDGGATAPGGGVDAPAPGAGGEDEPPEKTYRYASIDVRFGRAGTPLREIRDVPRLAPLPNAANPIVIFLGMRGDHETAVFMLSTDVHAQGDGRCVPSEKVCEAIELRLDDVAFLDVSAADGTVTQYELSVVAVELHETTSRTRAARAHARTSRSGRWLVRQRAATSAVASGLRFSLRSGTLEPVPGTFLERAERRRGEARERTAAGPRAAAGVRGGDGREPAAAPALVPAP